MKKLDLHRVMFRHLQHNEYEFLNEMLFEAIYLPAEQKQRLSRDIIFHPDLKKYYIDWGREGDIALVAVHRKTGKLLGCSWGRLFTVEKKGYGFVSENIPEVSLAVKSEYRDMGIGTKLLRKLIEEYKQSGFYMVSLSVSKTNPVVNLYLRENFNILRENQSDLLMLFDPDNRYKELN